MKKWIVAFMGVASVFSAGQLGAQTNDVAPPMHHHGWMSPEKRMNRLSEELNLTEDQKTKVQAIFEDMRQKVQAAIGEAKTNADSQLQGVLTPEQYAKFQSLWQQHQHRFRHGGSGDTNGNNDQSGQQ